jgi:hypothetical protein
MATQNLYASQFNNLHSPTKARATCDGATYTDFVVEGSLAVWTVSGALGAATDVFVRDYDSSRNANYLRESEQPVIVIKCASDASVNNVLVKSEAGSTLYTFATDCSATPKYCVLRLKTDGAWELA